jgi:hypothetical protein
MAKDKKQFTPCEKCKNQPECIKAGKCALSKPKSKPSKPGKLGIYNR